MAYTSSLSLFGWWQSLKSGLEIGLVKRGGGRVQDAEDAKLVVNCKIRRRSSSSAKVPFFWNIGRVLSILVMTTSWERRRKEAARLIKSTERTGRVLYKEVQYLAIQVSTDNQLRDWDKEQRIKKKPCGFSRGCYKFWLFSCVAIHRKEAGGWRIRWKCLFFYEEKRATLKIETLRF